MNRNQQIKFQIARFLHQQYVVDNSGKINLLDLYEAYISYVFDNCIGYQTSIGDVAKEIKEVYPQVVIDDTKSINGLSKKVPKESIPTPRDVLGDVIIRRLNHLTRGAPESFRAAELAGVDSIDNEDLDLEKVTEWLSKSEMLFYNKHTNRWIKSR